MPEILATASQVNKGFGYSLFLGKNFRWGITIVLILLLSIHGIMESIDKRSPMPLIKELSLRIFPSDALLDDYTNQIRSDPSILTFTDKFLDNVKIFINYAFVWISLLSNLWFLYIFWYMLTLLFTWMSGIQVEQKFIIGLLTAFIVIGLQVWGSKYFFIDHYSGQQLPNYSEADKIRMNMPMSGTINFISYLLERSSTAYDNYNLSVTKEEINNVVYPP